MSSTSSIPDDIAVWGDELLTQGDPLGEIIARALRGEEDAELQSLYEHAHFKIGRGKCTWKNGVLDEIKIDTNWGHDAMDEITRCPAARFLRVLDFMLTPNEDLGTFDPTPVLALRGLPKTLRDLTFWPREVKSDMSNVYSHISNIERLSLWGPDVLGTMDLPQLKWLRLVRFLPPTYIEFRAAKLPELETLELFASPWFAFEGLELRGAPKLQKLVLGRPPWEPYMSGTTERLAAYAVREWRTFFSNPISKSVRELEFATPLGFERESVLPDFFSELTRYERIVMRPTRDKQLGETLKELLGSRLEWTS